MTLDLNIGGHRLSAAVVSSTADRR